MTLPPHASPDAPTRRRWTCPVLIPLGGLALSLPCASMTQFVLLFWVVLRSDTPFFIAGAGLAGALPLALFARTGERLALRHGHRRVLCGIHAAETAVLLALIVALQADRLEVWLAGLGMMLRSLLVALQLAATHAGLHALAPPGARTALMRVSQSLQCVFLILCAPVSALAFAIPPQRALQADLAASLCTALALLFARPPCGQRKPDAHPAGIEDFDL